MKRKNLYKPAFISFITSTFLFIISNTNAQVIINEYSASNLHNFLDNYDKTEDWIELYNTSGTEVDISGWHLTDKESKPGKWEIPAGTTISGNGFLVFWCSGRDEAINGHFHTNFKLSQTTGNDKVILTDASEIIVDAHDLDLTLVEHSRCRTTDGADTWAICTEPTLGTSNNDAPQYERYTQTPKMSLTAGFYSGSQTVAIQNQEPNSVLRYTTNGHNPTTSSPVYSGQIPITSTTVVKARAFSNDSSVLPGKMDFNTYFINENFSVVVFSVAADDVIDLANGNGNLIPIGSLEYFNLDKEREATAFGSLNRHGQDSWALPHRSLDWVTRDEMGYSKAVYAKLFGYSDRDKYQKFMFRNSGDDNYPANDDPVHDGCTHIRDEYVQSLALLGNMRVDIRAVERAVVFLNGQYWGLYGLRERPVDNDYVKKYYKQGKYDINFLTTWGTTKAQYGGVRAFYDWYNLRNFALNNDMSDAENFNVIKENLDLISFIDYFVANQSVVAKDWLNYNTGWWRGLNPDKKHTKWGYLLWDLDATFGYYINYTGVPNTSPDAEPCDIGEISNSMDSFFGGDDISIPANPAECNSIINNSCPYSGDDETFQAVIFQYPECCNYWSSSCQNHYNNMQNSYEIEVFNNFGKHEKLFIKFQEESAEFRQLYYARQADLFNTVYSCENMTTLLDSMLAIIAPEMPRQIQRWGGSMDEWHANVNDLKTFINQRCQLLDDGMVSCFDVTGPYELTVNSSPEGIGDVKLNTIDLTALPWTGEYYGNMENTIKATVKSDYEDEYIFSHWESSSGNTISPDGLSADASLLLTTQDTLTAVFTLISGFNDPEAVSYFDVFPNPAKENINIKYSLKTGSEVELSMLSLFGKKVLEISEGNIFQQKGEHIITFTPDYYNLPGGVYLIRLMVNNSVFTKKITLIN